MSVEHDFYVNPPVPCQRTPAPHEGRVEFLRPPEARTRWHPTVTTFGPWVKVPLSVFLLGYQLIRISHAVHDGTFVGGPPLAFELVEVLIWYVVAGLIVKALWASGKSDRRTIGG